MTQMLDELRDLWAKDGKLEHIGFRDDMRDILQWVCYCRHHQPVPYAFFHQMQCFQVPLPSFDAEQVRQALKQLGDSETKDKLAKYA